MHVCMYVYIKNALSGCNNKGIVEIIEDNEYEESDYEETSHMMEISSVSLGDLRGEDFVVDNDHEEVKEIGSSP